MHKLLYTTLKAFSAGSLPFGALGAIMISNAIT